MLVIKIHQGKYYTTLKRLLHLSDGGIIKKEEKDGLMFFSSLTGNFLCCCNDTADFIEINPK